MSFSSGQTKLSVLSGVRIERVSVERGSTVLPFIQDRSNSCITTLFILT